MIRFKFWRYMMYWSLMMSLFVSYKLLSSFHHRWQQQQRLIKGESVSNAPQQLRPNLVYLPHIAYEPLLIEPSLIHVAITALSVGENVESLIRLVGNVIRSVRLFTTSASVQIHIVTNDRVESELRRKYTQSSSIRYYRTNLEGRWLTLFAIGSAQRLFLHTLLPVDVRKVIYLDLDTVSLRDLGELWKLFQLFDSKQCVAATRESEILDGYYLRHSDERLPYVYPVGINAGVLLLDLEKLRRVEPEWSNEVNRILFHYDGMLHTGDQDVLNILFHRKAEYLFLLPCEWNIREDSWCRMERANDLGIVHGSRKRFEIENEDHWLHSFTKLVENHPFEKSEIWGFQYESKRLRLPHH